MSVQQVLLMLLLMAVGFGVGSYGKDLYRRKFKKGQYSSTYTTPKNTSGMKRSSTKKVKKKRK